MAGYGCNQPFRYFHERYAFTACESVASGVRYRGRDNDLTDGCVMVLEPGETHFNTYVAKPSTFKVCFVDSDLFDESLRELGCPQANHFPSAPIGKEARLFPVLQKLCISMENGDDALTQQCLLASCLTAFCPHADDMVRRGVTNGKVAVERAKIHLRDRFDEAISLSELAAVSRLSQFHLVHSFTNHVGFPPHAYQLHIRVERGRALLAKGMSPAQVAAIVGFADQSHFTRHFKRVMHVTPSEYARSGMRSKRGYIDFGASDFL